MKEKGFSIIEIIVTTGLIAVLSVIVFSNYNQMGRQVFLEEQTYVLMSAVSEVRNIALAVREVQELGTGDPVDEYTITFEEDGYVLLEDTDHRAPHNFEGPIRITDGAGKEVGFVPPDPSVNFRDETGNEINENEITIRLEHLDEEVDPIEVKINKAGLIRRVDP